MADINSQSILPTNELYRNLFVKTPTFDSYTIDRNRSLDEPTYLGFKILFHFNDPMSPLLNESTDVNDNTAINYLIKNNYLKQAQKLKNFIAMLRYISQRSEWYFQKIEGLDQIIGWDFVENKIRLDKQFVIHTLEGLDLRINSLIDNYVQACYDVNTRSVVLPRNLRYFAMSIYVTDLREFADSYYDSDDKKQGDFSHGLEDSSTRPSLFYRLDLCEFDKNSKGSLLQTIDNNQRDPMDNKLVINQFGEIFEYPLYILSEYFNATGVQEEKPQDILSTIKSNPLSDKIKGKIIGDYRNNIDAFKDGSDALNEIKNKYGDKDFRIKNTLKEDYNSEFLNKAKNKINNALEKTLLNGINDLENKLSGVIQPLILGNVYNTGDINTARRSIKQVLDQGLTIIK